MDLHYIIKVAICFSGMYLCYVLFLQKTTFHKANRILLIWILVLSLYLPTINLQHGDIYNNTLNINTFEIGEFDGFVNSINENVRIVNSKTVNHINIILLIYFSGILFFSIKSINEFLKIISIRRKNNVVKKGNLTFIYHKNNTAPFSFFYWIFIPDELRNNSEIKPIIEHEKAHATQLHTLDLLLTEIFSIFFWFVPFVYSFKNSIKSVHEFLADKKVTNSNFNKISYLKLLANETEKYTLIGLSSNFYCKTLKNRITMITKKQTPKTSFVRFLLIIPIIAFILQSFQFVSINKPIETYTEITNSNEISFIYPIADDKYEISSRFGMRMHPVKKEKRMHNGIDFKAKMGTPVMASAGGKIVRKEFKENGYGKVIAIEHDNGFYTLYSQLSEFKTEIGKTVSQGEIIGLVGSSGYSTGPHLHFEIRKNQEFQNPEDYLK